MKLLLLLTIAAVCYSLPLMSPYKSLDVSMAAKDPIIAQLLDFGTQNLIQQALADKELPHDKFRLAKVNSIHMQSLNGFNYKFNIDLQDDNGVAVNSAFTMHYQPKTNEKSVSSLTYTLKESHPALRPERFYELDISSYRQNPVVLNLLEFGVQNLLMKSFEAKTVNSQLRFEKLQKAQKQELGLDEGSYYHFKADFKDGAGNKVLGSMTMFYNPNTGEKEMIDSSYDVQKFVSQLQLKNKMTQNVDDYFDVDVGAIAEKPEIENALNFGVTQLIEKAIADKQIPVSEYVVENVLEVKRQVTGAGTNYWFDVTLTNHKDTVVDADFIVFTRDSDQEMKLLEFESHVETTVGATEKPVEPDAQKYQLLTKEEAAHDEDLQACLKYGIASALLRVKDDVDIDSTEISNADVQTVEKQTTGNVEFYRFNVDLGSDSLTVTTTFTVANDLATGEKGLKNLLYKIIPVKGDGVIPTDSEGYTFIDLIDVQRIPEIKQNLEFGVIQIITQALAAKNAPVDVYVLSEIQSAKKLMVGETTYYKFVVQLSNNRGTIIQARFTVKYNIQTIRRSLEDSYYEVMEPCA